jgi:hypothetical protein
MLCRLFLSGPIFILLDLSPIPFLSVALNAVISQTTNAYTGSEPIPLYVSKITHSQCYAAKDVGLT